MRLTSWLLICSLVLICVEGAKSKGKKKEEKSGQKGKFDNKKQNGKVNSNENNHKFKEGKKSLFIKNQTPIEQKTSKQNPLNKNGKSPEQRSTEKKPKRSEEKKGQKTSKSKEKKSKEKSKEQKSMEKSKEKKSKEKYVKGGKSKDSKEKINYKNLLTKYGKSMERKSKEKGSEENKSQKTPKSKEKNPKEKSKEKKSKEKSKEKTSKEKTSKEKKSMEKSKEKKSKEKSKEKKSKEKKSKVKTSKEKKSMEKSKEKKSKEKKSKEKSKEKKSKEKTSKKKTSKEKKSKEKSKEKKSKEKTSKEKSKEKNSKEKSKEKKSMEKSKEKTSKEKKSKEKYVKGGKSKDSKEEIKYKNPPTKYGKSIEKKSKEEKPKRSEENKSQKKPKSKEKKSKEKSKEKKFKEKSKEEKSKEKKSKDKTSKKKNSKEKKSKNSKEGIKDKNPPTKYGKSMEKSKEKTPKRSEENKNPKKRNSKERKPIHSKEVKLNDDVHEKPKTQKEPTTRTEFVGCYKDGFRRLLVTARFADNRMTNDLCISLCKKKRTRYAGVEHGNECYCGNDVRRYGQVKRSQCKMPCRGNKRQQCGGVWRISVFKVGTQEPPSKPKCHSRAALRNGRCECNRGYYGDGINACDKTCTCMASGDPHYKTYDGQMIHFMGTCKYTLTKTSKNYKDCSFSVEVKNERRGRNIKVAYTRTVDVKIYGTTIRLSKGGKVSINGQKKFLPVEENKKQIKIFRSGKFVQVWTKCGLEVNFDGVHRVSVITPAKYKGFLEGICGDCNGKKDDFKTKDGKDVSSVKNKYALIGNSHSVVDDSDDPVTRCETEDVPLDCEPKMNNLVNEPYICGDLQNVNGRFGSCVKAIPLTAREYYRACVIDMCSYQGEVQLLHEVKCSSLESFVEECLESGIEMNWRTEKFCPLKCKAPNMIYMISGPGCPATCVDPNAPLKCTLERQEGCFCKAGFVLSDDKCIKQSECGCRDNVGDYFPIGSKKGSTDCSREFVCKRVRGTPRFIVVSSRKKCHRNAVCNYNDEGVKSCICKKGYIGDGYKSCKRLCGMKYKCHSNARCIKNRCVCKRGLYGDGVSSCNKVCTCSASGDPHYRTYDGQMIHFMGDCMYTLTKSIRNIGNCSFNVEVKNRKRRVTDKVSLTRYVKVQLGKDSIKLDQDRTLFVNGQKKFLPFSSQYKNWEVHVTGKFLRLKTDCDVIVSWDGQAMVQVVIPKKYGSAVTGICGDCNGKKDDYRTSQGVDVSKQANKYSIIGDSYQVFSNEVGQNRKKCETSEDLPRCSKQKSKMFLKNNFCGFLNSNNIRSPFRNCIKALSVTAKEYLESCKEDACANVKNTGEMKKAVCMTLEAFGQECQLQGFNVKWRRPNLCPIKCGENMKYSTTVSGCPATCSNPIAPTTCTEQPMEGCECLPGYVLSDNKCIKQQECGCFRKGDYYPLNTKLNSPDCTIVEQCVSRNGEPIFINIANNIKCHQNGKCGLKNGERQCVCEDGFTGDGIRQCVSVTTPQMATNTQSDDRSDEDTTTEIVEDDIVITPKPPTCNHPDPECSVAVRHDSCGTEIMLTGNCVYSNQFTNQCQYIAKTGINSDGEYVADITLNSKKTRLGQTSTLKDCALFSMRGSILFITEDTCERCILQFIRSMVPKTSCVK